MVHLDRIKGVNMNSVIFKTIVLIGLAVIGYTYGAHLAHSSETHIEYGQGIQDNSHLLSGGRTYSLLGVLHARSSFGGIIDKSLEKGRSSTAFLNGQIGVDLQKDHLFFEGYTGPGLISSQDDRLSSPYQLFSNASLGVRALGLDAKVGYMHISNAGMKGPNLGRDFILFGIGLPL